MKLVPVAKILKVAGVSVSTFEGRYNVVDETGKVCGTGFLHVDPAPAGGVKQSSVIWFEPES